jgi:hypothetical protein
LLVLQLFLVPIVGKESSESEVTSATDDDVNKTASNVSDRQVTSSVCNETRKVDIDLSMIDASDDETTESTVASKRQKVLGGTSSNSKVRGGTSSKQGEKRIPKPTTTTPSRESNTKRKGGSMKLEEKITETPLSIQTQIFQLGLM